MIITKTPFRISLFGGGTDIPIWYRENGGEVISFSIDKYCYLTTRVLPPFFEHKYRIAYSLVETAKEISDIKHPVVREAIRKFSPNVNLEIHHDGDLPARSGMGSSSAFTVGIIHALLTLCNKRFTQIDLADFAIDMEQNILKENVGSQDQIACALGGMNHISFGPGNKWNYEKMEISYDLQYQLEDRMFLVYTGLSRSSSEVSAKLFEDISLKESHLNRLVELTKSCKEVIMDEKDLDQIGEMLDESWQLKKRLNANSSNDFLDDIYSKAKKAGALGGKVLGAGGGGFFLFWLPRDGSASFEKHFKTGLKVPFSMSHEGSKVVYNSDLAES